MILLDAFNITPYITSPYALTAYAIAAVMTYFIIRNNNDQKKIESAKAEDRANLIIKTGERLNLDLTGLDNIERATIIKIALRNRIITQLIFAVVIIIIGFLIALKINDRKTEPIENMNKVDTATTPEEDTNPSRVPPKLNCDSLSPIQITFLNSGNTQGLDVGEVSGWNLGDSGLFTILKAKERMYYQKKSLIKIDFTISNLNSEKGKEYTLVFNFFRQRKKVDQFSCSEKIEKDEPKILTRNFEKFFEINNFCVDSVTLDQPENYKTF